MNELTKTMTFGAVALASAVAALATRPAPVTTRTESLVEKPLFEKFTDPTDAKSLKIVRFDETLSKLDELQVRESEGIWTLPSHEGYPADAENRVRDATAPFVDLKPLAVVSEQAGDHSLYGVLEPGSGKSAVGDQGVGTLVNVTNASGDTLVDLIIGKSDKSNPELRFVRRPKQQHVFVAKVNPDRLPVRFEDWIERDLLKLNGFDIKQLVLKDYTFQVASGLRGPIPDFDQRLEVTLADTSGKWVLEKMLIPQGKRLEPAELAENEEINQERLNGLKDALDRLEIVDVERKPKGLGEDLRADQGFFSDEAGVDSLLQRGFYPVQMGSDVELLSSDGEVLVRTKEGVEYVLRFGRVKGVDTQSEEGKLNRYLLVSARVNVAEFPEPALMPLPETVEDIPASPPVTPAPEGPTGTPPAPDATGEPQSSKKIEDATRTQPVAFQDPAAVGETPADGAESATATAVEAAPPETPVAETPPTEPAAQPEAAPATAGTVTAESPTTPAAPPADAGDPQQLLQAERERITKENQRKIDERNANLAKAQKKVSELNYRFADWYYVISEDVYKKIHLGQTDIIQEKKAAEESGVGVDALRNLQNLIPGQGAPQQ